MSLTMFMDDGTPAAPEAGNDQEVPPRKVGCENEDGTLNIHLESETCAVCEPQPIRPATPDEIAAQRESAFRHGAMRGERQAHPVSAEPEKQDKRPEMPNDDEGKFWLTERWVAGALVDGNLESGDSDSIEDAKHCMSEACWKSLVENVAALRAENARLEKELVGLRESRDKYKKIAHDLWNRGSYLYSNLKDSLTLNPDNWHVEAAQQKLAEWSQAADTYFDAALASAAKLEEPKP